MFKMCDNMKEEMHLPTEVSEYLFSDLNHQINLEQLIRSSKEMDHITLTDIEQPRLMDGRENLDSAVRSDLIWNRNKSAVPEAKLLDNKAEIYFQQSLVYPTEIQLTAEESEDFSQQIYLDELSGASTEMDETMIMESEQPRVKDKSEDPNSDLSSDISWHGAFGLTNLSNGEKEREVQRNLEYINTESEYMSPYLAEKLQQINLDELIKALAEINETMLVERESDINSDISWHEDEGAVGFSKLANGVEEKMFKQNVDITNPIFRSPFRSSPAEKKMSKNQTHKADIPGQTEVKIVETPTATIIKSPEDLTYIKTSAVKELLEKMSSQLAVYGINIKIIQTAKELGFQIVQPMTEASTKQQGNTRETAGKPQQPSIFQPAVNRFQQTSPALEGTSEEPQHFIQLIENGVPLPPICSSPLKISPGKKNRSLYTADAEVDTKLKEFVKPGPEADFYDEFEANLVHNGRDVALTVFCSPQNLRDIDSNSVMK